MLYLHVCSWGQSLANGNRDKDDEPITKVPEPIPNVHRAQSDGSLIPLKAIVTATAAQQPGISMAYRIAEAHPEAEVVFSNHAQGARRIDRLSKGGDTGVYEALVSTVLSTRQAVEGQGDEHLIVMSGGWQGEADELSTPPAVWAQYVRQLRLDLEADLGEPVRLVFGQTSRWPMYRSDASIALAQVMAHRNGDIVLAGTEYQWPYRNDNTNAHHEQIAYYWAGEKVAQAWLAVESGAGWDPIMPVEDDIDFTDTHIDIPYTVPVPPLRWDTELVPTQLHRGFRLTGTAAGITGVELLPDGTTVRIHLSKPIVEVGAAVQYGTHTNWQGNLADSDPLRSKINEAGELVTNPDDGYPLPNFAVQHRIHLPVEPGQDVIWLAGDTFYFGESTGMIRIHHVG